MSKGYKDQHRHIGTVAERNLDKAPEGREISVPMTTVRIDGRDWVVPVPVAEYIQDLQSSLDAW